MTLQLGQDLAGGSSPPRGHQLKGLSGSGGPLSETAHVHTLGKLHLAISWGLSQGGRMGVSLTPLGAEL